MLRVHNLIEGRAINYTYETRQELLDYYDSLLHGCVNIPSRLKLFEDAYDGGGEGIILEIGIYFGASLIALAAGSKMANREYVVGIDIETVLTFEQMFSQGVHHLSPCFATKMLQNLIVCGVRDWIIPVFQHNIVASKIINIPIRLLHVDGDHTAEGIAFDLKYYGDLLVSGGIIHCHDYNAEPITSAVNEYIRDSDDYTDFKVIAPEIEQTYAARAVKK